MNESAAVSLLRFLLAEHWRLCGKQKLLEQNADSLQRREAALGSVQPLVLSVGEGQKNRKFSVGGMCQNKILVSNCRNVSSTQTLLLLCDQKLNQHRTKTTRLLTVRYKVKTIYLLLFLKTVKRNERFSLFIDR